MKHSLLLSFLSIAFLTSCSTAFKAGQTPDDVYFSPGRSVPIVKEDETQRQQNAEYLDYVSSLDDRYLHMKVANRSRWGVIDDYDYWYDSRYDFGTYNYYHSLNPYTSWNPTWNLGLTYSLYCPGYNGWGWNSPIYTLVNYAIPSYSGGGYTAGSNITAYHNKTYNNSNYGYRDPKTGAFTPANNNSSFGSLLKRVFSSDNTTSYDRPTRSFSTTPTNSAPATSSSAGGSSGGFHSTGSSTSTGRGGRG